MRKSRWKRKRFWALSLLAVILLVLLSNPSVQMILKTAPNDPRPYPAEPKLSYPDLKSWEASKNNWRERLQNSLYGNYPTDLMLSESNTIRVTDNMNGRAVIEYKTFRITNLANGASKKFSLVLLKPKNSSEPSPLILTQNFCPNHNVVAFTDIPVPEGLNFTCDGSGVFSALMQFFFGRYIVSPPFEDIIDKGYAIAVMHPPEFIADQSSRSVNERKELFSNYPKKSRPGTLIAWAAQAVLTTEELKKDPGISAVIHWGHSRYGKVGLLAAAHSDAIDGVVAHQSGTAGASLSRNKPGETLLELVDGYPHWLGEDAKGYAAYDNSLPLDQHHLLALIAPRPVLLGNARRDVWSDPEGAFRAGYGANHAYKLYGSKGITADRLKDFHPHDDISFWIRPGTHGVVKEDWPAFLEFLEYHFPP